MSNNTDILSDILNSLGDEESEMIEKTATDANVLTNTENSEASKKIPSEKPHSSEKKLGLSILNKNKYQDDIRTLAGIEANKRDNAGTENISPKKMPVEPGLVFEKKASAEVIADIYAASGIDLEKVASEDTQNDMLLKMAEDTLAEFQDLEKIAEVLAEATAEKFMALIEQ